MLGDSAEVKDFIAFLRLAFNPDDRVALVRCLTQFPGVGEASAERIRLDGRRSRTTNSSRSSARCRAARATSRRGWKTCARRKDVGARGEYLLNVIFPLIERNYPQNSSERMATLKVLVDSMKATSLTMEEFLDAFSLETIDRGGPSRFGNLRRDHPRQQGPGVRLRRASAARAAARCRIPKSIEPEAYEEERRLMYVAVTRARQRLLITYPIDALSISGQSASPFLPPKFPWDEVQLARFNRFGRLPPHAKRPAKKIGRRSREEQPPDRN